MLKGSVRNMRRASKRSALVSSKFPPNRIRIEYFEYLMILKKFFSEKFVNISMKRFSSSNAVLKRFGICFNNSIYCIYMLQSEAVSS